jgi:hypothetical protein
MGMHTHLTKGSGGGHENGATLPSYIVITKK